MVHHRGNRIGCLLEQMASTNGRRAGFGQYAVMMMVFDQIIAAYLTILGACSNDRYFTAKVNKAFCNEGSRRWRQCAFTTNCIFKLMPSNGNITFFFDDKLTFT